jgi:hypothetical protein
MWALRRSKRSARPDARLRRAMSRLTPRLPHGESSAARPLGGTAAEPCARPARHAQSRAASARGV